MRKIAVLSVLASSLLVVPAIGAQAKPGGSGGRGDHAGGKAGEQHGRCARPLRRAFVASGLFTSFTATDDTADAPTAGDLTVDLKHGNHHAHSYLGSQTFSTVGARVSLRGVTDANADGAVGFDDVTTTDQVRLIGKVVRPKRGCGDDPATVVLRKVMVRRPAPPAPDDQD